MLAERRKAGKNKFVYLGAGIGLFVLSVLLVVLFVVRRTGQMHLTRDWGALVLGIVGILFAVIMFYQSANMRRVEESLGEALAEEGEPAVDFAPGPTAQVPHVDESEPDEGRGADEP